MADIKFTLKAESDNFDATIEKGMQELHDLGTAMKSTAAEMKNAFRELGKQSFEIGGEKAVEYFRQQVELSNEKVFELATALNELKKTDGFDATSDEAKELMQALADAQERAAEFQAALEGAEKASHDSLANAAKDGKALGDALNNIPGPMNGAVGGLRKLVTAAKAFIATPIGAIIGAVVAVLGLLRTYLTGTAEGQVKAAKAGAVLGSVLDSMKDVAIKMGKAISEAFENPKEAINKFVDAIKKNLMTRLEGLAQGFKAVGKMVKALLDRDWEGMKDASDEIRNAQVKVFTGKGIDEWKEKWNGAKEAMSAFAEKTAKTAEEMGKLKQRELDLRKQRNEWQIKEAAMDEQIAKERMKAYDEEATPAERAEALAKTQDLITKKYEKQIEFAKEDLAIQKARNAAHESPIEDIEKENDLQANIVQLQAQMASELASVERRRATAAKQAKEEEFKRGQEALSLEVQIGETRLSMQDESLKKQLEQIELEKKRKQIELEGQKHEWEVSQHGKLTPEQEAYIKNMSALIEEAADAEANKVIFDKYADAAAKAFKEQAKFDEEAKLLEGKGVSTTEVRRQQNNAALAFMQSEEQEINPHFETWVESLMELTADQLEGMLANAEKALAELAADPNADQNKVMEARARVAALRKELKSANKDISRGADVKKYENLNKVLGDAAKGFEELGQTGNEAFDSIMKDVSEVLTSVQSVVGNIQTLVTSSIEAEKQAAKEGASAVKAVEKASVILAIIGAVISLAMKLKSMIDDTGDLTAKLNENVEKLRAALAQVKRELAVDVSGNKSIFGENQFKDLQQYTQAATDYADAYQQAVDKVAKSGFVSTLWKNAEGRKTFKGQKAYDLADLIFDQNDIKAYGNSLNEAINTMLDQTQIKTREKGWLGLRKEKYESLREVLGDDVNLIGKSDEETIKNLQALLDTQDELPPETKKVIEEMIADWDTYNEAIEGVKSTFANFFSGMTDAFADSIKTGFEEGAGAGKAAFTKSVNEMVSDFVLQMRIGERTAKMQEEYTQKMTDAAGDRRKEKDVAIAYADELKRMYDEEMDYYEDLQSDLEARGYGLKDALDGTLSGAIKGASQESIDLLSGYCNAVRIQQVDGINIMRDQLISLSGIERNTLNTNTILTAIRGDLAMQFASDDVRAAG